MKSIEIKNPAIDHNKVAEELQNIMAQIPDIGDLATSGPPELHGRIITEHSAEDMIRPLISYFPQTILKETQFTSPTPVIGPLMLYFRRAWNWMSTKWYVLPVLVQQSKINADLLMFLIKSVQNQEKQAEKIAALEARITQLETRLARIQEK